MTDVLSDYFDALTESFLSTLHTPQDYLNKIALTAVIVIIGVLLYRLLKMLITRNTKDYQKRFMLHKVFKRTATTLVAVIILFVWIRAINALILAALLFGIFIVVMVRGLINNIIGYFVIKYRKYFKEGHRMEIRGIIGDVIDRNMIHFELLEVRNWLSSDTNTGRVIKLPNKIIFDETIEIVGVTNTLIWHEIQYVLTFDSHWQDAEKIMTDAGTTYYNREIVPMLGETNDILLSDREQSQPVFSLDTNNEGIVVTLRYLVDYQQVTSTKTILQREILSKFDQHPKIHFAVVDIRILPT